MRIAKERRRDTAWKLRVYVDAIKDAEAMSSNDWMNNWIKHGDLDQSFLMRSIWIEVLRKWALDEATRLTNDNAA